MFDSRRPEPTLWGRMVARLQGELPATTLEAYRRTGLHVFELLDQAEARRLACATEGMDPWSVPPAMRAELLCAWNAFVLQTLGNAILDADYAAEPVTAGFVPPATAELVLGFYAPVEGWLNRAQQAAANPDFRLDVAVPADLPPWTDQGVVPVPHVQGVMQAMFSVSHHAGAAMSLFDGAAPEDAAHQGQLNRIRQVYAAAQTKARYATDLHGVEPTRELHDKVGPHARDAMELFYQLGQLIADPTLAAPAPGDEGGDKRHPQAGLLPGQAGFDVWCLSDPAARETLKGQRRATRALRKMWDLDPDPVRTLGLHAEIRAAFERGDIGHARKGVERVGHFHCCPWSPVYVVRRPVTLGGTALKTLQQFVYDVGARNRSEAFRRRILVGAFHQTEEIEYGPNQG